MLTIYWVFCMKTLYPTLSQALHYLVLISEVDEKEIFKICLEYWNHLTSELYHENPFSSSQSPLMLSTNNIPPRRQLYLPVLSKVSSYVFPPILPLHLSFNPFFSPLLIIISFPFCVKTLSPCVLDYLISGHKL